MIPFLDLSSWNVENGPIDYPLCSRWLLDIDPEAGVIIKVNEGLDYENPAFHEMRYEFRANGIKNIGLYDFARPSRNTGHAEATAFLDKIVEFGTPTRWNEFYAIDVEDDQVTPTADLDAFVLDWAIHIPLLPVFYSARYYMTPHNLVHDPALHRFLLWYAQYSGIPPADLPGWLIKLWQYSSNVQVPGIIGNVDISVLNGTIDVLRPYQHV